MVAQTYQELYVVKKIVRAWVCAMFCMLVPGLLFAGHEHYTSPGDARAFGLSHAYTAVAHDHNTLFMNPAGLDTIPDRRFRFTLGYEDYADPRSFGEQQYTPIFIPRFVFTAPGWGVGMHSTYYMNPSDFNNGAYEVTKVNTLDVGAAMGIGMLSFGVSLQASKESVTDNISMGQHNLSIGAIYDLALDLMLSDYEPKGDAYDVLVMKAGILFDTGIVSVGAYHEKLFDFMAWSQDREFPAFNGLTDDLNVGIGLRSRRIDQFGRINTFRVMGSLDVDHIGDDDRRMLQLGVEGGLYLTDYNRIAVRAGYAEQLENLSDVLVGAIQPSRGTFSLGVGVELLHISADAAIQIPATALPLFNETGDDPYDGELPKLRITGGISF